MVGGSLLYTITKQYTRNIKNFISLQLIINIIYSMYVYSCIYYKLGVLLENCTLVKNKKKISVP